MDSFAVEDKLVDEKDNPAWERNLEKEYEEEEEAEDSSSELHQSSFLYFDSNEEEEEAQPQGERDSQIDSLYKLFQSL